MASPCSSSLTSRELFAPERAARLETLRIVGNITQNQHTGPDTGERTSMPAPVEWSPGGPVRLVDQTLLPRQLTYRVPDYRRPRRGLSPYPASARRAAIGIAAAYGLCLAADLSTAPASPALVRDLEEAASVLRATGQPPSTSRGRSTACWRLPGLPRPRVYRPCARRSTPRPAPSMSRTPAQTPSWASTALPSCATA